ncbi:hypothetical protein [Collinsella bouchesdurhonensis]|nr:hypothetical protein [Collinsella bouchesdurhonensis]
MTTFTTPTKHNRPAETHFADPRPRHRAVLARATVPCSHAGAGAA